MKHPFFWTWVRLSKRNCARLAARLTASRQVLITVLVVAVALPLCIWDLAVHNHEAAYVGACCSPPSRLPARSAAVREALRVARPADARRCGASASEAGAERSVLHAPLLHAAAWFIAGLFVLVAIPVSAYGVQAHMEHYHVPRLQKHVVRILWMPVVYGLDSWLALRFKARAPLLRRRLRACALTPRARRVCACAGPEHLL